MLQFLFIFHQGVRSRFIPIFYMPLVERRPVVRIGIRDRIVTIDVSKAIFATIVSITTSFHNAEARQRTESETTTFFENRISVPDHLT